MDLRFLSPPLLPSWSVVSTGVDPEIVCAVHTGCSIPEKHPILYREPHRLMGMVGKDIKMENVWKHLCLLYLFLFAAEQDGSGEPSFSQLCPHKCDLESSPRGKGVRVLPHPSVFPPGGCCCCLPGH